MFDLFNISYFVLLILSNDLFLIEFQFYDYIKNLDAGSVWCYQMLYKNNRVKRQDIYSLIQSVGNKFNAFKDKCPLMIMFVIP